MPSWLKNDNMPSVEKTKKKEARKFTVGDHIYHWCSYLGVPFVYQQHAIVLAVLDDENAPDAMKSILVMNFDPEEEVDNKKDHNDKIIEEINLEEERNEEIVVGDDDDDDDDEKREREEGEKGIEEENNEGIKKEQEKKGLKTTKEGDKVKKANVGSNMENETTTVKTEEDYSVDVISPENDATSQKSDDISTKSSSQPIQYCKMIPIIIPWDECQSQWEHVQYSLSWNKRLLQRAGTCSGVQSDPIPLVLDRIRFLEENSHLVSELEYHSHKCNGECVAFWCTTGTYMSLQGAAKMGDAGMHVGSFSIIGGLAAQLAITAVVPVAAPFLTAMDMGSGLFSAKEVHTTKAEWNERNELWNTLYLQWKTKK